MTKRTPIIVFLCLTLSIPAHAQGTPDNIDFEWWTDLSWTKAAIYGVTAFDYGTTRWARSKGYAESNPILGQDPVRQAVLIFGATYALDVISNHLDNRGYTGLAWALRAVHIASHGSAAIYNAQLQPVWERWPAIFSRP